MRGGALLLTMIALAGCAKERPLFVADCNDGSRIAGVREFIEGRCARRGGIRTIAPLPEPAPADGNGTGS